MERRLFLDYLRRFYAGFLILPLYLILIVIVGIATEEDMTLLVPQSFLLIVVFLVFLTTDLNQNDIVRTIQSLPASRHAYSRTLWWETVPVPVAMGGLHFALAHVLLSALVPGKFYLWHFLPPFILVALMVTSGYFFFLFLFVRGSLSITLRIGCVLSAIGLLLLCRLMWIFWQGHPAVMTAAIAGAIAFTAFAYRMAPFLLGYRSGYRKPEVEDASPARPSHLPENQDMAIHWIDVVLGHPVYLVALGSASLILLSGLSYFVYHQYLGPMERLLSPLLFVILFCLALFVFFVILSGSFISSMRAFSCLPIPKSRLATICLLLPSIALLPVALISVVISPVLLAAYAFCVACWQICNAVYLQWNKLIAAVVLQVILVVLGIWQFAYTSLRIAKNPEALSMVSDIGIALTLSMLAASLVWTWRLLKHSNAPYQKKPDLRSLL